MIIGRDIKSKLQQEFIESKCIWIATAMISYTGWKFIQNNLPKNVEQNFLIGIDLATDPRVFDDLLINLHINSRVYQTKYTFHPKVYLIQKRDNSFTAFIGSSNTTNWGLEKNIEMNFQISDQLECQKLLQWFQEYYKIGYLITEDFVSEYKSRFNKIAVRHKEITIEKNELNCEISKDQGQFFSRNNHQIFESKYHRLQTNDLKFLRKEVSDKFRSIHNSIYPKFKEYGLYDLHCHHNSSQIVSRHYFNRFSGNFVNAMWLHYGKSVRQLEKYKTADKSVNRPDSFINNVRIQVIIHPKSIGVWLVLGKDNGSKFDRIHFKEQMNNPQIRNAFFKGIKKLGNNYWINIPDIPPITDMESSEELHKHIQKERIDKYFIIGCHIDWLDERLSAKNISKTILEEFQKLYPIYKIMKH